MEPAESSTSRRASEKSGLSGRQRVQRSVKFDPSFTNSHQTSSTGIEEAEGGFQQSFPNEDGEEDLGGYLSPPPPPPPFVLTREDVEAAFDFLDVDGSGLLTLSNLKERLSAFYPNLTSKEYKFLIEDPSGIPNAFSTNINSDFPQTARTAGSPGPEPFHGGDQAGSPSNANSEMAAIMDLYQGRPSGSVARAGINIEQLWDLISSFQHLQHSVLDGNPTVAGVSAQPSSRYAQSSGATNMDASMPSFNNLISTDVFDAVREAFRVYDPRATKYVDEETLACIMARIGFGKLSDEDLAVLVRTADFDGDGRISLDDFRQLVNMKGRFKK